ncbi:AAA family ATPase [Bacillus sp. DJP31]|uniref:AAA family ATPase n=1 Tax=Bacillus sp. DJP31 TaxID=3409789 RepID=UPI003BB53956
MKPSNFKKIHIIGSVGSGKTTLARRLSFELNIPYYEIDNLVWKRSGNGDIRNSEDDRNEQLRTIIQSDNWIIEGVHSEEWVEQSFQHADVIVFLDPKYSVRTKRIIKRFILQKFGKEKANYKPTIKIFYTMFKWNRMFEDRKPSILTKLEVYSDKLIVLKEDKYKTNEVIK